MTDTIFRIEYIIGHEMELYERSANIQQIFDTLLLLAGGSILIDIIYEFTVYVRDRGDDYLYVFSPHRCAM